MSKFDAFMEVFERFIFRLVTPTMMFMSAIIPLSRWAVDDSLPFPWFALVALMGGIAAIARRD